MKIGDRNGNHFFWMLSLFVFLLILLLFSGCSSQSKRSYSAQSSPSMSKALPNASLIKKALYLQHKSWEGTSYKLGGNSKKGIDCSAFVQVTFLKQFAIKLPRTTKLQAKVGKRVFKRNLKAGDLVFFKTGFNVRHVGIYLENQRFLHASVSRGVMISQLNNRYWVKKYWKAVRVAG